MLHTTVAGQGQLELHLEPSRSEGGEGTTATGKTEALSHEQNTLVNTGSYTTKFIVELIIHSTGQLATSVAYYSGFKCQKSFVSDTTPLLGILILHARDTQLTKPSTWKFGKFIGQKNYIR